MQKFVVNIIYGDLNEKAIRVFFFILQSLVFGPTAF